MSTIDRRLRAEIEPGDESRVREIVASTGFFSTEEIDIAVELVAERRSRGDASGYHFLFLEVAGETVGYSCYGPICATVGSFDLYWIAVDSAARRHGHGRCLMRETERVILERGGERVWVDTSSRPQYGPTRSFYERCGYRLAAELIDFYRSGENKVIYSKRLDSAPE